MTGQDSDLAGKLITLEGIEGVGKSTNVGFVAELLRNAQKTVVVTREPGGVDCAERIRALLLNGKPGEMPPMTELLLMFAARAAHLSQLILPALKRGEWVVCDRFTDASYAYQGSGRGLPLDAVRQLELIVQGEVKPDLTLLLDADWEQTLARRTRRQVSDRFETEDASFFRRVRAGYLDLARRDPERIRVIDASRPLAEVQLAIRSAVTELLK